MLTVPSKDPISACGVFCDVIRGVVSVKIPCPRPPQNQILLNQKTHHFNTLWIVKLGLFSFSAAFY